MICRHCGTEWEKRHEDLQVNGEYRGHTTVMCRDVIIDMLAERDADVVRLREGLSVLTTAVADAEDGGTMIRDWPAFQLAMRALADDAERKQ